MRHALCVVSLACLLVASFAPSLLAGEEDARAAVAVSLAFRDTSAAKSCPCGTVCGCAACDGVSCDTSLYRWEAFTDDDQSQCKLMKGQQQVGVWRRTDGVFYPLIDFQWGAACAPPIPPPTRWPASPRRNVVSAPVPQFVGGGVSTGSCSTGR